MAGEAWARECAPAVAGLTVEQGWDDAVEAVLRERLNSLEVADLEAVLRGAEGSAPARRVALFAHGGGGTDP